VFFHLSEIRPGATIQILRRDGDTAIFTVTSVQEFSKNSFPTGIVYGHTVRPELRLITCSGASDSTQHRYDGNLVVFAQFPSVQH
jgi:hypothetical protein